MRIAVTGGLGKAGQWIVRELTSGVDGSDVHEVVVFDRTPRAKEKHVCYLAGDILDLGQVFAAFSGCDAVVHLAGVPTNGIVTDDVTFRTNVVGTFNVYEAAYRLGIRRVLTVGSEAVLGWSPTSWIRESPPEYLPVDEDHPLRPQDAYGMSKLASEVVARSFTDKGGPDTIVLRPPRVVSARRASVIAGIRRNQSSSFRALSLHRCARLSEGVSAGCRATNVRFQRAVCRLG